MPSTNKRDAKKDADVLSAMRARYARGEEYWRRKYDQAIEDIKFVSVPGNQWDTALKARRDQRPCYEFPKLRMLVQQIINEQKQSRPQGKVRGMEDGDRALAEIMTGICRNIESVSNAEQAYDIAYENAVRGGLGWWRITTDYARPDDFDLDIRIEPVRNFAAVIIDPAAVKPDRRDAEWAIVKDSISEDEFKRRFPDADAAGFFEDAECADFRDAGKVVVAEYWWKKPVKRTLWRLSTGAVVFEDEAGLTADELALAGIGIEQQRQVDGHKVMCALTNGHQFLTDPVEFPSSFIPLVPCWAFLDLIDGDEHFAGAVRFNRDSQRLHNVHKTAAIEAVAKAPKAPFITKLSWIKGFESFWKKANSEDYPYLPIAEEATGTPIRAQQAELPAALLQLASLDNDDMRAQTGQYAANIGAPSNETSGRAIGLRRAQGATATFNYIDGLIQAIRYTYEILVDMIPRVYDTPRVVRTLGADGAEKWVQLYREVMDPQTGERVVLNDISKGKYDVAITVGPSYATQRMEAADAFTQLAAQVGAAVPGLGPLLAYQVVKNLDLPGSEEVDTALRKLLIGQGLIPPGENDEPPPPPQPDPRVEAELRKMLAGAAKDEATAAKTAAEAQLVLPQGELEMRAALQKLIEEQARAMVAAGFAQQVIPQAPMDPFAGQPVAMPAPEPAPQYPPGMGIPTGF